MSATRRTGFRTQRRSGRRAADAPSGGGHRCGLTPNKFRPKIAPGRFL
jgi:hypothetical protein